MPNYHYTRLRFVGTPEEIEALIAEVRAHKSAEEEKKLKDKDTTAGQATSGKEKKKSRGKRVKVDVTDLHWDDLVLGLDPVDILETKPTKISANGDQIDFYAVSAWSSPASNIRAIVKHFSNLTIEQCDVDEDVIGQGVNIQKFAKGQLVSQKRIASRTDPQFKIEVMDVMGMTKKRYDENYGKKQEEEEEEEGGAKSQQQDLLRMLTGGRTF